MEVLGREVRTTIKLSETEIGSMSKLYGEPEGTRMLFNAVQAEYQRRWSTRQASLTWNSRDTMTVCGPPCHADRCQMELRRDLQAAVARFGEVA